MGLLLHYRLSLHRIGRQNIFLLLLDGGINFDEVCYRRKNEARPANIQVMHMGCLAVLLFYSDLTAKASHRVSFLKPKCQLPLCLLQPSCM